jgi:polysaccharide pyruvyl transferase WcaK-like protein
MIAGENNKPHTVRKIGIFGHVGNKNLGDEAIISAIIQNIKRRRPEAQIYGFTLNPEDTENRHKITAFQIQRQGGLRGNRDESTTNKISQKLRSVSDLVKSKTKSIRVVYDLLRVMKRSWDTFWESLAEARFLVQCYRNLKGIDLLIIAGSQQLIDYIGGPWEHSYTVFKWVLLAKIVKAKVAFVSVGAGPIRSSLGKCFVRNSLLLASYRSYRDETSRRLAETLGISAQNNVFPDLVYSLQINLPSTNRLSPESPPIVGINPVPFFDAQSWLGANPGEYAIYISKLAIFSLWLIQRGYRILFFPTQLRLDPPVITDIKNLMHVNSNGCLEQKIFEKPIYSFDDLVSAIRMTNIVVATRFHGIVIPFVLNRPVLGIAYQRKTIDLMAQMGQSEYVVDIHSFDPDSLKARFMLLETRSEKIRKEIEQHKSAFCHALQSQYDQVLNLV